MVLAYSFDPVTRALTESEEARPDPMAPDNWLLPAFSTTQPPPEAKPGLWPYMGTDLRWHLQDDLRAIPRWTIDSALGALAEAIQARVVAFDGCHAPIEREIWKEKRAAADIVLRGGDSDLLDAEAQMTGESVLELASKIARKRRARWRLIAGLTGIRRSLEAALELETHPRDIHKSVDKALRAVQSFNPEDPPLPPFGKAFRRADPQSTE